MTGYDAELVRPMEKGGSESKRRMVLAAVAGTACVLAAVAVAGGAQRRSTGLSERGSIIITAADAPDARAKAAAAHAMIMADAAQDDNDRSGLSSALKDAGAKASSKTGGYSANIKEITHRMYEAQEEKPSAMVPWVHWPGHPHTGGGDQYKVARKQSLLQMPMLTQVDNAAQVMPLKELIQRQTVDHLLHTGHVSDYELAAADAKSHGARGGSRQEDARGSSGLDCAPFC